MYEPISIPPKHTVQSLTVLKKKLTKSQSEWVI